MDIKEIKLSGQPSTMAIMEYADNNPDFSARPAMFTFDRGYCLVSVLDPIEMQATIDYMFEFGIEPLSNGWRRLGSNASWTCYKGNKVLFITLESSF